MGTYQYLLICQVEVYHILSIDDVSGHLLVLDGSLLKLLFAELGRFDVEQSFHSAFERVSARARVIGRILRSSPHQLDVCLPEMKTVNLKTIA